MRYLTQEAHPARLNEREEEGREIYSPLFMAHLGRPVVSTARDAV